MTSPAPVTALRGRHLLGIGDLSPEEITLILDTADAMREVGERPIKKVPALRGRTIVNLFFEPSTRTRTSFEIAEKRLSADTLNLAVSTSSVVKGETLPTVTGRADDFTWPPRPRTAGEPATVAPKAAAN